MQAKKLYFNETALKKRGWRESMIARFLGGPEEIPPKSLRRRERRQKLYLRARVEEAEKSDDFKAALARANAQAGARSRASLAAHDIKRQELLEEIKGIVVEVPRHSMQSVRIAAIEHWKKRRRRRDASSADEKTVRRWMVNYLRHQCTFYDGHLRTLKGRVGKPVAAALIKTAALRAISEKYPELRGECERQSPSG